MSESSCDEIRAMLFDYLDGILSEADRDKVEDHFRVCPDCKKEYEQYRALRAMVRDSAYRPKRDLSAAFMEAAVGKKASRPRLRLRYTAITTAAAALVIVTAVFLAQKVPFAKFGSLTADAAPMAAEEAADGVAYALLESKAETAAETFAAAASGAVNAAGDAEIEELEEAVDDAVGYGNEETVPETAAPAVAPAMLSIQPKAAKAEAEVPKEEAEEAADSPNSNADMRSAAKTDGLTGTQAFADAGTDAYSWLVRYAPDCADTVSGWYVADTSEKALASFAAEKARLLADDETCTAYLWEGDASEVQGLLTDGGKWQAFSQGVPDGTPPRVLIVLKK